MKKRESTRSEDKERERIVREKEGKRGKRGRRGRERRKREREEKEGKRETERKRGRERERAISRLANRVALKGGRCAIPDSGQQALSGGITTSGPL